MLTLNAYAFHNHPRRDTRPYIRASITDFSVPKPKPYLLAAEHDPLAWSTGFVTFPPPAESPKSKQSQTKLRAEWLRAVRHARSSVPEWPAGADFTAAKAGVRGAPRAWGEFKKRSQSVG